MNVPVDVATLKKIAEYIGTTQPIVERQAGLEQALTVEKTNFQKQAESRRAMLEGLADALVKNRVIPSENRDTLLQKMASFDAPAIVDVINRALGSAKIAVDSLGSGITPATTHSSPGTGDEFDAFVNT